MIQADNLTKRYGRFTAVDNLSFNIERGEICGFLGPNGAGKTSTMRILTGYMPPTQGKATVAGFDVFTDPLEVKKRVGYLPESTPLYTDMRVAEYLDFVAELKGFRGSAKRAQVAEVMEMTQVTHRQRSLISSLSKGYRQRVGLAQAMVSDPQILILDEPTIGLDPRQIIDIRAMIKDLAGRRTVILSSHMLSEVQMICSRALIINKGRLVAADTIDQLSGAHEPRLTVKIDGPVGEVGPAIERIDGVTGITADERPNNGEDPGAVTTWRLHCDDEPGVRRQVTRMVVERGWDLIELTGAVSLEEAYIKLITRHEITPSSNGPDTEKEQREESAE